MEEIRSGRMPFCKLDILHRRNLDRILPRFGIAGVSEDVLADLNRPGIGSMRGRIPRPASRACERNS